MAVKGKPYKGLILTCLVFLIIYNIYVSDLDRKMAERALSYTKNCISWGLVPWEGTDVQGPLQVPRGQNKTLHGSVQGAGTATLLDCVEPLPTAGTHLTCLLLLKSQVVAALQNTFPLSCLNSMRAWSLPNRSPSSRV